MLTVDCMSTTVDTVDNPCGKLCGECGKLAVINRYFRVMQKFTQLWKTMCIAVEVAFYGNRLYVLRYRVETETVEKNQAKMFGSSVKLSS